jgi:DNA-binding protein Fis
MKKPIPKEKKKPTPKKQKSLDDYIDQLIDAFLEDYDGVDLSDTPKEKLEEIRKGLFNKFMAILMDMMND